MKFAIDLHIHSALSPCGDRDMTPCNIVNMAILKGLDLIALTDHNSCKNLKSIIEVGIQCGIMVIPGVEVQSKEEVHILCYFRTLANALSFDAILEEHLPNIKNKPEIFGEQLFLDCDDNIIGREEKLLLSSVDLSIEEIFSLVRNLGGIAIPAHIDRASYSIISSLGFIPQSLGVKTVEISKNSKRTFEEFKCIKSSDAHYLWDINERESFLEIDELTFTNIFEALN